MTQVRRSIGRAVLVLMSGLLFTILTHATYADNASQSLQDQRSQYKKAKQLLQKNEYQTYRQSYGFNNHTLKDYVLFPLLQYNYLKKQIDTASVDEINQYLIRYEFAAVSQDLRQQWLSRLAQKHQWREFLSFYSGPIRDKALKCNRLTALMRTGTSIDKMDKDVLSIWRSGKSLPKSCDPVFAAWQKAGLINGQRVWERINLAFAKGNTSLASYLAKQYLSKSDRQWVQRWINIRANPEQSLGKINYPTDSQIAKKIILYGIERLARRDANSASRLWQQLQAKHKFNKAFVGDVYDRIGFRAALQRNPDAVTWFKQARLSNDSYPWYVRAALFQQQWTQVLSTLNAMEKQSPDHAGESEWQYWRARALAATGDKAGADTIYRQLAAKRSYYGFLSAAKIEQPLAMNDQRIDVSAEQISQLVEKPGITMARELLAIGDISSARRQWSWAMRGFNRQQHLSAAVLAQGWNWSSRAIVAMANAASWDDLSLRFPLEHEKIIVQQATQNRIDPNWAYGVIRQESAFMRDISSSAGALGLMQLMPATARQVARTLGIKIPGRSSIVNVPTNIKLGSRYLRTVMDKLGQHVVLATAAYNAGPHRVMEWLPKDKKLPADIWIENIPFKETRGYVKNVLAYSRVYDYRRQTPPRYLTKIMSDIPRRNSL